MARYCSVAFKRALTLLTFLFAFPSFPLLLPFPTHSSIFPSLSLLLLLPFFPLPFFFTFPSPSLLPFPFYSSLMASPSLSLLPLPFPSLIPLPFPSSPLDFLPQQLDSTTLYTPATFESYLPFS